MITTSPPSPGLAHVRRADLERALRHHRRAIDALAGRAFEELPERTASALLRRLEAARDALDAELRGRPPDNVPDWA